MMFSKVKRQLGEQILIKFEEKSPFRRIYQNFFKIWEPTWSPGADEGEVGALDFDLVLELAFDLALVFVPYPLYFLHL